MPKSLRIAVNDPAKKKMPEDRIGIQKDLPTPRCLIAPKVFRPSAVKKTAIRARGISKIRIMVLTIATIFFLV